MLRNNRLLMLFIVGVILFQTVLAVSVGLDRQTWGDEWHFVETVRLFGDEISLTTLTKYDEMSTPLPFIMYGLWGRLVGFEIERLRLLSLLLAVVTYLLLFILLSKLLDSRRSAILGTVFVIVHPYMIGFSLFVFTDMSAILFMVAACLAMNRGRPVWFALMLAAAMLCRQYLAFVFLAAMIFFIMQWCHRRDTMPRSMLMATVLSSLPLLLLFWLWGDVHPDNLRKQFYVAETFRYHPSAFVLYISQLFWYLLPVVLTRWRRFYSDYRLWLVATAVSVCYFAFPVTVSASAVEAGTHTVGLLHSSLVGLGGDAWLVSAVFYVGFLFGLPVLLSVVRDTYLRLRDRRLDYELFLDLCILSFLLLMPLTYLTWEKYFMPLVPLGTARFLLPHKGNPQKTRAE